MMSKPGRGDDDVDVALPAVLGLDTRRGEAADLVGHQLDVVASERLVPTVVDNGRRVIGAQSGMSFSIRSGDHRPLP
jgi:hypothetical protein